MADDQEKGTLITLRDGTKTFARATGAAHRFVLRRFRGTVIDVEDVHFNLNSAVMLPDFADFGGAPDAADQSAVTGLAVIAAVYDQLEAEPQQKLLIAGHADRSGPAAYNLELSRMRAENVLALLQGKRDEWVAISQKKHRVRDYQQILKWADATRDWGCDPGKVDDDHGSRTTTAIEAFQRRFNKDFTASIATNGAVDGPTWGAFFDVYLDTIRTTIGVDKGGLATKQASLRFVDAARPTVGCGEHHPITKNPIANRTSRIDRRVEILFFDPGEEPQLNQCHPGPTSCKPASCELYEKKAFNLRPRPVPPKPRPPRPPKPSAEKGALAVQVNDEDNGRALAGVDVRITGPESRNGLTDASGTSAFADLAPGSYKIEALLTGQTGDPATAQELVPANQTTVARLTLKAPAGVVDIKGALFWNRTWNYNDEKTAIAAVKEFLPGAKVELRIQKKGAAAVTVHASAFLTDDGAFTFTAVPESTKAALRIHLEYRGGKVVKVVGKSNAESNPDFEIKTGVVVWHELALDATKIVPGPVVDFGDLEVKRAHFIDIADAYKTVWFGHKRIKDLAGHDLPLCPVNYPQAATGTSHHVGGQLHLLTLDLKDRDVILHEYGHLIENAVLPGKTHPGYGYNDDIKKQHGRTTKEHYEAAWFEGSATFLSCAMGDDPHYHDGYDATLDYHLDKDNTTIGPHSEGSIQETLWAIYKTHGTSFKDGFWKAWTDKSKRTVRSASALYKNWKDLGLANLDKVVLAYKKFGMEFVYEYRDGGERFEAVAAPKTFDAAAKQFVTIAELHNAFGKVGSGSLADYREELYNRNKQFNAGALDAGSTPGNPKIKVGNKYILPVRFKVE